MKTQNELNAIKKELEGLNNKLRELTEEELKEVAGGMPMTIIIPKYGPDGTPIGFDTYTIDVPM